MSSARRTRLCDMSSCGGGSQPVKTTAPAAVDTPTALRKSRRLSPNGVARSWGLNSSLIKRSCPPRRFGCDGYQRWPVMTRQPSVVTRRAFGGCSVVAMGVDAVAHVLLAHVHGVHNAAALPG